MSTTATPYEINCELARRINDEARRNPQSPYANKYVGIAGGQVVVVSDDFDDMIAKLRQAEPDARKCLGLDANEDLDQVHEIWGLD
jgi:hypothetical protein